MASQKIILVIDDEPDLREMIQYQLESNGFKVHTAVNGVDGLKKLKLIKPDLIILDMNMPEMGGREFFKKIIGQDENAQYPILVLTANLNIEGLFQDFNVDGYLAKPFTIDELLRAINVILNNRFKKTL